MAVTLKNWRTYHTGKQTMIDEEENIMETQIKCISIYKMIKYLNNFVSESPRHYLDLFDKLVRPILKHACEVWGFANAPVIERIHLHFCKRILGVKRLRKTNLYIVKLEGPS